jgi:hypothetical protein
MERLWAKVDRSGACWLWTGSVDANGYGVIRKDGRLVKPHRLVYEAEYGPIPDGMVIRHRCGHNACVRPEHLLAMR